MAHLTELHLYTISKSYAAPSRKPKTTTTNLHTEIYETVVDAVTKKEETSNFGKWTVVSIMISILCHFIDIYTDSTNATAMYMEGHSNWFLWTVVFIVLPQVITNILSFYWYWQDDHECQKVGHVVGTVETKSSKITWFIRTVCHLCLLGPVLRYIDVFRYGYKSQHAEKVPKYYNQPPKCATYYIMYVHEIRDVSLLELVHSFLGDALQSVLQIYIMVLTNAPIFSRSIAFLGYPCNQGSGQSSLCYVNSQAVAIGTSLMAIAWSLSSYHKALRFAILNKENLNWCGTICQFLWRLGTVSSRIFALGLFASHFKWWVIPVVLFHLAIMLIWTFCQKTDFCQNEHGQTKFWEEKFYNIVTACISVTCFFNVKDEATRLKNLLFYILVFSEDTVMILLWYRYATITNWDHEAVIIGVFSSFFVGIFFMISYYRYFHPTGKMPDFTQEARIC